MSYQNSRTLKALLSVSVVIVISLGEAGCTSKEFRQSAQETQRNHITRKLAFWQDALAKPVTERIGPAPAELVDYLALDNTINGYANKPRAATLSAEFIADVRNAIAEIPAPVQRLLAQKLAGIYFVDDLGGSGFTEQIYAASKPVAGYIVLDASVLQNNTANSWATWKENSPFKENPDFKLNATIEEASQDNRKQAIQYILLHELGHVLAIDAGINPNWNTDPKDIDTTASYPFLHLSWKFSKDTNRYLSIFDQSFPQREDVVYFFGAKLPAARMVDTYEALGRTNFATLYAVKNPHDDFAEAFVTYVHTVLMGKPFEITLSSGGKIAKVYKPCWAEERCAAKKKILERFLNQGDPVNN